MNTEVSELTLRRFWNVRQHTLLLCPCHDQSQQLCLSRSAKHEIGLNRLPYGRPHNRRDQNNRYVTTNRCNLQNLCHTPNRYKRNDPNVFISVFNSLGYVRSGCSAPARPTCLLFSLLTKLLTGMSRIHNIRNHRSGFSGRGC